MGILIGFPFLFRFFSVFTPFVVGLVARLDLELGVEVVEEEVVVLEVELGFGLEAVKRLVASN